MIANTRHLALTARTLGLVALAAGFAAVVVGLCLHELMIGLGVLYVTVFLALAWFRPDVALALCFAATPLQNDLSGGGGMARFSIAEVNIVLIIPVLYARMLVRGELPKMGPLAWAVALFLGSSVYSSALTWRAQSAPISLAQMAIYLVVCVIVFSTLVPDLPKLKLGLYLYLPVTTVIAIGVLVVRSGYVFGLHKNGSGASLGIAIIVALELYFSEKRPWMRRLLALSLVLLSPAVLVAMSRGSWLGAASGVVLLTLMRRQFALLLKLVVVLVPVIAVCWNALPQESRDYATDFGHDRRNIEARYDNIDFAKQYFHESPWFGKGVGIRKEHDATNIVWFTLAETGVVGLATFALLHITFFGMIWWTRRYVSPDDPAYSLLAAGAALVMYRLMHGMVDHYWQRGPAFVAWSAAGMAVSVYFQARARRRAERPR